MAWQAWPQTANTAWSQRGLRELLRQKPQLPRRWGPAVKKENPNLLGISEFKLLNLDVLWQCCYLGLNPAFFEEVDDLSLYTLVELEEVLGVGINGASDIVKALIDIIGHVEEI